jgi:hypothetical protein
LTLVGLLVVVVVVVIVVDAVVVVVVIVVVDLVVFAVDDTNDVLCQRYKTFYVVINLCV